MSSQILRDRLDRFLASVSMSVEDLISEVEQAFGTPLLVLATGSVLQGFGNSNSDLDLNVVVDRQSTSQVPIMSFARQLRIDTAFYHSSDVREWVKTAKECTCPLPPPITREVWSRQLRALGIAMRFALGLGCAPTHSG